MINKSWRNRNSKVAKMFYKNPQQIYKLQITDIFFKQKQQAC